MSDLSLQLQQAVSQPPYLATLTPGSYAREIKVSSIGPRYVGNT